MMGRVAQSSGRAMTLSQLASGHPAAGLQLVMELRATELHSGSMKVRAGGVGVVTRCTAQGPALNHLVLGAAHHECRPASQIVVPWLCC